MLNAGVVELFDIRFFQRGGAAGLICVALHCMASVAGEEQKDFLWGVCDADAGSGFDQAGVQDMKLREAAFGGGPSLFVS
jgi:hypothetical protein